MKRKEVLYQGRHLLGIDIYEDVKDADGNDAKDYSIFWNGRVPYNVLLNTAEKIHYDVSARATKEGISEPEKYLTIGKVLKG